MTTFSELIATQATSPQPLPDTWKQGRTAYGGLSASLLLAAIRDSHASLPPLRSALVNFTGPVSHPRTTCELLRQGRNVTTVSARMSENDRTVCTGTFSFGTSRDSHVSLDRPSKGVSDPEETDAFMPPGMEKFVPNFTRNFDMRLIEGDRPMSGAKRGYIRAWARHKDQAAWNTEVGLLCLADILPPAVMPMFTQMGPVSSMSWICNFLHEPTTRDGWYQVEAEATATRDGYSSQVMRMWNRDGDLIVDGMQSIAVFT